MYISFTRKNERTSEQVSERAFKDQRLWTQSSALRFLILRIDLSRRRRRRDVARRILAGETLGNAVAVPICRVGRRQSLPMLRDARVSRRGTSRTS